MRIFVNVPSFLVIIASKTFSLSLDKVDTKSNILTYFWKKSSLAHFQSAPELSANLILVTTFHFKLKFSVEKLMEIS